MKTMTNGKGLTAIYVRRSVSDSYKGNNSLSINAQKEECIRFVGDEPYRIYCDDGKSGKDVTHRPAFMQMMTDARNGEISRIVVKKYDRFSRNMREYLNITDELDRYGVSVYSLSEPFNTSTKEGRMMRNNLLNFAEFERETIAARVADAYNTKARETGFYQGGKMYYGYDSERRKVNGKTGSVLIPSEQAESVRIAFQMYQNPDCSLKDIIEYFQDNDIVTRRTGNYKSKGRINQSHVSLILESPLYVRADKDVYAYFQSMGYEIIDGIEAYDGIHGVFSHKDNEGKTYVKIGYHEGLVDSKTWLTVQDKKAHNKKFPNNGKAKSSWLAGLLKCSHCGYSIQLNIQHNKTGTRTWKYLIDFGFSTLNGCKRRTLKTRLDDVEEAVYMAMCDKIKSLEVTRHEDNAPDAEIESLKAEILKYDDDIHKLMDKLPDADDILFAYIQKRVKEYHKAKSKLENKLQTKCRKHKAIDTKPLKEPLKNWDSLTIEAKHEVAVMMIDAVYVSDEDGIYVQFCI